MLGKTAASGPVLEKTSGRRAARWNRIGVAVRWNGRRPLRISDPRVAWADNSTLASDENGRKNPISTSVSIFFWRKRNRVRKIRFRKRNRNIRTYGNEQIRTESRKIKLRSHNIIFLKYTYIKSCNNIYKV
jgi:hypothetical protein